MLTIQRKVLIVSLFVAAALGTGCNLLSLPFFLFAPEPKKEPALKRIATDDKNKEVRLAIVTYTGLETRSELLQADRQLAELLSKHLKTLFEQNKENVRIVPVRRVEEYKNNHPNWHQELDTAQIGRHLKADYVAYLEITNMTVYERGSVNQMYRGRADISVTLVDVNRPDDTEHKEFTHTFPSDAKGPIPVQDITINQFRHVFLDAVARRLSWYFAAHPQDKEYEFD